jgi:hypothetical protein
MKTVDQQIETFADSIATQVLEPESSAHTIAGPGSSEMAEACALVNGTRQDDYGTPRSNYEGIAKVWSGILNPILKRDITPDEAALMMVGLKLQRQAQKHKRDNLVDAHGYLLVYAHIRGDGQ